ncbi:MAG: CarD family transcriptional regulator [Clostridia bacterium]|nr:CarD family transcriptional regulator [Clostridia bacterium]
MFGKGDYVFHASGGICRVEDLQYAPLVGMPADRLYYVLRSLHDANGVIYLPTDCTTVFLRPTLTREEATALVREAPEIRTLSAPDAKTLRLAYVDAMKTHDPREWMRVIKTVSEREEALAKASRTQRLSETERSYGEEAKRYLFTELSLALDIPIDEMEERVFGTPAQIG